jgi:F-type H+-transporting ATPase subunit gamma
MVVRGRLEVRQEQFLDVVDESVAQGVETAVYTVGKKAGDYFKRRGYTIFVRHDDFNGDATASRGRMVGDAAVSAFLDGTFDEVRVVYSQFVSTMTQRPMNLSLLPIAPDAEGSGEQKTAAALDYIWEPSQEVMFKILLPLYLRNRVFMTLSEAFTSEHAARMTSMTAATENAGEMIEALTLQRNRERQAAITAELLDIVGGANAL